MSNSEFVKGTCRNCGGHLEFPAPAIGQTIACPHCGQPTVLAATIPANRAGTSNVSGRLWLVVGLVVSLVAAGLAGAFYWKWGGNRDGTAETKVASPAQSNAPTVAATAPPVAPEPQPEETTNDFAIMPFKLEKTPGSSLVYVIGSVRNLSDSHRFGVKIEFSLFDTNDNPVGSATDYQSVLDPHGEWHFRALVMASKTVSARFNSIAEEK